MVSGLWARLPDGDARPATGRGLPEASSSAPDPQPTAGAPRLPWVRGREDLASPSQRRHTLECARTSGGQRGRRVSLENTPHTHPRPPPKLSLPKSPESYGFSFRGVRLKHPDSQPQRKEETFYNLSAGLQGQAHTGCVPFWNFPLNYLHRSSPQTSAASRQTQGGIYSSAQSHFSEGSLLS